MCGEVSGGPPEEEEGFVGFWRSGCGWDGGGGDE